MLIEFDSSFSKSLDKLNYKVVQHRIEQAIFDFKKE